MLTPARTADNPGEALNRRKKDPQSSGNVQTAQKPKDWTPGKLVGARDEASIQMREEL